MQDDPRILDEFRDELQRSKLSRVAVDHYVGVVRRGLLAGDGADLLIALREARSPSAAKLARAGLLRWARWRKDVALINQIPAVPYLPDKVPAVRCTTGMRDRLIAAIDHLPDRERPVFEIGLRSAVKIGMLLAWPRRRVLRIADVSDKAIKALRTARDWRVLGDLLGPSPHAAYAVYRRRLIVLCERAGIDPPLRPNELRLLADREQRAHSPGGGA